MTQVSFNFLFRKDNREENPFNLKIQTQPFGSFFDSINFLISGKVCSGHGECFDDGSCKCEEDYHGSACHISKCPNDCSITNGHCDRNLHKCICNDGFGGSDCGQIISDGLWEVIEPTRNFTPPELASSASIVYDNKLFVIGGKNYRQSHDAIFVYDLKGNFWETVDVQGEVPSKRYGSSLVTFDDQILMFGGVVEGIGISNELWSFNITSKTWKQVPFVNMQCGLSELCTPLASTGHTASYHRKNNVMIVMFGFSPVYGYLNVVQEYDVGKREWRIVKNNGYPMKGRYGHSATIIDELEFVYVYGGITSESDTKKKITDELFRFEIQTGTWTQLARSMKPRYLHSSQFGASLGLLLIFGGNSHVDTTRSEGAKCFSSDFMMYDVKCDRWIYREMPKDLQTDTARFGHVTGIVDDLFDDVSLWVFGGFDGQMRNDLIRLTLGSCQSLKTFEHCSLNRSDVTCDWSVESSKCGRDLVKTNGEDGCPNSNQSDNAKEKQCSEQSSCQECISISGCGFCSDGKMETGSSCVYKKCPMADKRTKMEPSRQLDACIASDSICKQLHNCASCSAAPSCYWKIQDDKCQPLGKLSRKETFRCLQPPCSMHDSCNYCTNNNCIWCDSQDKCVDKNAFVVNFPYGECREWTTTNSKCRPEGVSRCTHYKNCSSCREDPECGWCDDETGTETGKCMAGGSSGSRDENECNGNLWHFTNCPSCQCNGHSKCKDGSTCDECDGHIKGLNCEMCESGYFGDPLNGGQCQKCECNGHAKECDSKTGKCLCLIKGYSGRNCQECDKYKLYKGNPFIDGCFFELYNGYQYTHNLTRKSDSHYKQINFQYEAAKVDLDVTLVIVCENAAFLNITARTLNKPDKTIVSNVECKEYNQRFSQNHFQFGLDDRNLALTTFRVYIFQMKMPNLIRISFQQHKEPNWTDTEDSMKSMFFKSAV